MKKVYQLPNAAEQPFQGKDRFMKDKQKRYVKLDSDTSGTMGYWDKTCVPMYTLELEQDGSQLTCSLCRQEIKKGKAKRPHDKLLALLVGLAAFVLLYLILGVLARLHPAIVFPISALVGVLVGLGVGLIYFFEYRSFYKLLDRYLKKAVKATPKK